MAGGVVQANSNAKLDLKIIDETYGKNADLYEDVLKVPTTATHDEIQLAYFDRRSELFALLAKIDAAARGSQSKSVAASVDQKRNLAEKKMDSIVFAVRVLADPALRKAYNGIRSERTAYALKQSPSGASESSTTSNNHKSNKQIQQQHQHQHRVVTPTEEVEPKNWIQSTFSASLFSSIGSSPVDDAEEHGDEERNPRKTKRWQKQQQSSSSLPNRDETIPESYPESTGEKEKKSIWGRKKRKKKRPSKDEDGGIFLNDSMDTNATDTSMTDHEDTNYKNKKSLRPLLKSNEMSPHEAVRRGGERRRNERSNSGSLLSAETDGDDETLRDDDTRTFLGDDGETFASGSLFSDPDEKTAVCGGEDGMFGCIAGSKAFQRIATEVSDACEDTLVSVDQVFNAFTLTDKDIKAVKKKIDKAKRQLEN